MKEKYLAKITFDMPYDPAVSVNRAYFRGRATSKKRSETIAWLWNFESELRYHMSIMGIGQPLRNVKMDITIALSRAQRRGQKPDPSNFRKIPQDTAASALKIDDNVFYGTDHILERSEGDSYIRFDFEWEYEETWEEFTKRYDKPNPLMISENWGVISRLYTGPLSTAARKIMGLPKSLKVCVGFGSAFCMRCSYFEDFLNGEGGPIGPQYEPECPAVYSPGVYTDIPCKKCNIKECPCLAGDDRYEERKEAIELWWTAKEKSFKHAVQNW